MITPVIVYQLHFNPFFGAADDYVTVLHRGLGNPRREESSAVLADCNTCKARLAMRGIDGATQVLGVILFEGLSTKIVGGIGDGPTDNS